MIRKFFAALGCAVLGAAVMLLALPLLPRQLLPHGRAETLAATEAETAPAEPADEPFDGAVTLRVLVDGAVREQTLHDYLVCVLLAEVPSRLCGRGAQGAGLCRADIRPAAGRGGQARGGRRLRQRRLLPGLVRPGAVAGARGGGGGRDRDGRACRRL